ncbi:MAG: DinB family protein, partial [Salibacteraceae bacterium]|nr:DinB family protein [Salibacteraceae bacterium]
AKNIKNDPEFKGGWFAEKTANDMLPKGDKVNTMKTFKNKIPDYSSMSVTMIDRFLKQQHQMLSLLDQAQKVDIKKVKCNLTLPIIKVNMGSTFKFVIYHNQRHMWQASNVLNQQR